MKRGIQDKKTLVHARRKEKKNKNNNNNNNNNNKTKIEHGTEIKY